MRNPLRRRPAAFAALLALLVIGLAGLPGRTAQAQLALPPHTFFGQIANVTVDGAPYDGVTPLEVVIADGTVVAVADLQSPNWVVDVLDGFGNVVFRVGSAVSDSYPAPGGALTEIAQLSLATPSTQPLTLLAGANLITWQGPETAATDFAETLPDDVLVSIFQFNNPVDGQPGIFSRFAPTAPAFLNTLRTLSPLQGYLFTVTENVTVNIELVDLTLVSVEPVSVEPEFASYTPWLGATTSPEGVLAAFSTPTAVRALFTWDATSQTFRRWGPDAPAFLNTLETVNQFDVLLIRLDGETTITQGGVTAAGLE